MAAAASDSAQDAGDAEGPLPCFRGQAISAQALADGIAADVAAGEPGAAAVAGLTVQDGKDTAVECLLTALQWPVQNAEQLSRRNFMARPANLASLQGSVRALLPTMLTAMAPDLDVEAVVKALPCALPFRTIRQLLLLATAHMILDPPSRGQLLLAARLATPGMVAALLSRALCDEPYQCLFVPHMGPTAMAQAARCISAVVLLYANNRPGDAARVPGLPGHTTVQACLRRGRLVYSDSTRVKAREVLAAFTEDTFDIRLLGVIGRSVWALAESEPDAPLRAVANWPMDHVAVQHTRCPSLLLTDMLRAHGSQQGAGGAAAPPAPDGPLAGLAPQVPTTPAQAAQHAAAAAAAEAAASVSGPVPEAVGAGGQLGASIETEEEDPVSFMGPGSSAVLPRGAR